MSERRKTPIDARPKTPRVISIGLLVEDAQLLAMEVRERDGALKGVRPLGGGVEFGETAAEAVAREFREEIALEITATGGPLVIENLFHFRGADKHEIVFVHQVAARDPRGARAALGPGPYRIEEEDGLVFIADWFPLADLRSGRLGIFPQALRRRLDGWAASA